MASLLRFVASAALTVVLLAPPAQARDASGRVGVSAWDGPMYGVTLEAPAGPLRLRGDAALVYTTPAWAVGVEWPWALPVGEVGPLLGMIQPPAARACPGNCTGLADTYGPGRLTVLVGASYRWQPGPLRVVLTPSVSVTPRDPIPIFGVGYLPQDPYVDPSATGMVGPPWLEVGYRLTPSVDVSVRTSALPLMVSWRFGGQPPREPQEPAPAAAPPRGPLGFTRP